eukprot:847098-Lingulodinium_polyedra.AAC.1
MDSSGPASSTDNQASEHSTTSKTRIEEEDIAGDAAPVIKDCLVSDEDMVAGTIIKPRTAQF